MGVLDCSCLYDLDRATALALASTCVDMRVTQIANQVWGVHALLPTGACPSVGPSQRHPESSDIDSSDPDL